MTLDRPTRRAATSRFDIERESPHEADLQTERVAARVLPHTVTVASVLQAAASRMVIVRNAKGSPMYVQLPPPAVPSDGEAASRGTQFVQLIEDLSKVAKRLQSGEARIGCTREEPQHERPPPSSSDLAAAIQSRKDALMTSSKDIDQLITVMRKAIASRQDRNPAPSLLRTEESAAPNLSDPYYLRLYSDTQLTLRGPADVTPHMILRSLQRLAFSGTLARQVGVTEVCHCTRSTVQFVMGIAAHGLSCRLSLEVPPEGEGSALGCSVTESTGASWSINLSLKGFQQSLYSALRREIAQNVEIAKANSEGHATASSKAAGADAALQGMQHVQHLVVLEAMRRRLLASSTTTLINKLVAFPARSTFCVQKGSSSGPGVTLGAGVLSGVCIQLDSGGDGVRHEASLQELSQL